jgi:hypothetical protein
MKVHRVSSRAWYQRFVLLFFLSGQFITNMFIAFDDWSKTGILILARTDFDSSFRFRSVQVMWVNKGLMVYLEDRFMGWKSTALHMVEIYNTLFVNIQSLLRSSYENEATSTQNVSWNMSLLCEYETFSKIASNKEGALSCDGRAKMELGPHLKSFKLEKLLNPSLHESTITTKHELYPTKNSKCLPLHISFPKLVTLSSPWSLALELLRLESTERRRSRVVLRKRQSMLDYGKQIGRQYVHNG